MKKVISLFLVFAACLSLCACSGRSKETYDEWPTVGLAVVLPEPQTKKIKTFDYGDAFSALIYSDDAIETFFSAYVASCESAGFTVDAEKTADSYEAYNQDGYRLRMHLFSSLKQVSLDLDSPKVNGTFAWPTIGLATMLPEPDTNVGTIQFDTSTQFSIWVGETSPDGYKAYVDACIAYGFALEHQNSEKKFSAKNADGVSLTLEYQGFQTMYISVRMKNDETDSAPAQEEPTEFTEQDDIKIEDVSYDWSQGILAEEVPLPEAEETEMVRDGNEDFRVKIYGDLAAFQKYVERCKKRGYTYEPNDSSVTYYSAFRKDGTRIEVNYDENEGLYELYVRESWIKDPLEWPESGLAALLPAPKGTTGKIIGDSAVYLSVFVGEMTKSDYLDYIEACRQSGFTLDEMVWEGYFSAHHETDNGNVVTVTYEGLDTIHIEVFTGQN